MNRPFQETTNERLKWYVQELLSDDCDAAIYQEIRLHLEVMNVPRQLRSAAWAGRLVMEEAALRWLDITEQVQ